jgi:L-cysteine/cystine lyase
MTFEEGRALFPVLETVAYLNAGTFGPLAEPVARAQAESLDRDLAQGRSGLAYLEETMTLRAELRAAFASLVGADVEQVALTGSTTDGCGIVLRGLGLEPDDEVVTTTDEHFGLLGPLAASGANVVVVEPEPEALVAAVTPRTKLIATSQVLWTTGAVLPLAEVRERSGVPVLADGAQSVGAIPSTSLGVDFLTISGQKWLCGPDSTGALVVTDPERLAVTSPTFLAQRKHRPDGTYEPQEGARRFEPGWWSQGALRGMRAALELRPDWWFERAWDAAERCRELLQARVEVVTPPVRSTLVAFHPAREEEAAADVVSRLFEAGVHVRELPGRGLVRVSCGWWTSDDDLDRLAASLAD